MKINRHALFVLVVLAALTLTACTLPTDPTFAGRTPDTQKAHPAATVAMERAQS